MSTPIARSGAAPERVTTSARGRPSDVESREWLLALRTGGPARDDAVDRLHGLLLSAACFELERRPASVPHLAGTIARRAADAALLSVLTHLDDFRGVSRFTTWASKFALREAAVELRKLAWQEPDARRAPGPRRVFSRAGLEPDDEVAQNELLSTLRTAMSAALTPHQRGVFVALELDGVPIDVHAARLHTTRGALYETLQDARRELRLHFASRGLPVA